MLSLDQVMGRLELETGVNFRRFGSATLFHSQNKMKVGEYIDSHKPDAMSELCLRSGDIKHGLSFEYALPMVMEAVRFIEIEVIGSIFVILHEADVGVQFSNEAESILKFLSNDQEAYQQYCSDLDFTKVGWNMRTAEVCEQYTYWCNFVDEWKNLPIR